ncbi:hypothetical protein [Halobacillus litoralis]|uniref:Uncharacterized protein n=1 Tax=Halobacillus litoralis TaxID=45668 RepID=A0A410MJH8_9BACI|nr:hypothetical protein [Halobacillus litoralis]QAS54828.1 hypothetical protein HLI_21485 [Halobacillus litoralis]
MEKINCFKIGEQLFRGVKNFSHRNDHTIIIEPSSYPTRSFIENISKFNRFEEVKVHIEGNEEWRTLSGPFHFEEYLGLLIFKKVI